MFRFSSSWLLCTLCGCVLWAGFCCSVLEAADFRIETKVFVQDEPEPVMENVTLFQRGVVYDFLDQPAHQITIYDPRQRHFTLLNSEHKVKTRVEERVLLQFVAQLKVRAMQKGGPLVRELASPEFAVEFDEMKNRLSLVGQRIEYEVQERRKAHDSFPDTAAAEEYYRFIDMYARLNSTLSARPPQARLELNRQMKLRKILPSHIQRTDRSPHPFYRGKASITSSEHIVAWQLLRGDQKRIDTANQQRANFTAVTLAKYRYLCEAPGAAGVNER